MLVTIARAVILYILIILCMRIMGKRQLGELQPTELVITILISEIAAIPMQDNALPLLNSIAAVALLSALEIFNSFLSLKSPALRGLLQGNSLVIIRNGKIDQRQMRRLRYSADDLLDQLRQKDIFDISDVKYAVLETNGQLSVMPKPEKQAATAELLGLKNETKGLLCLVVNDGKYLKRAGKECGMSKRQVLDTLKQKKIDIHQVMFMLCDELGNCTIVKKEKKK